MCLHHSNCPSGHLCCPDCHYTHPICKRTSTVEAFPLNSTCPWNDKGCGNNDALSTKSCPASIRRQFCPHFNLNAPKYSCSSPKDCMLGYLCCPDNCYDNQICKLPSGIFNHRHTINWVVEGPKRRHNCPPIGAKCTKAYSLRLAKKIMCVKDEDCSTSMEKCCQDVCIEHFKICLRIHTMITLS
jgi:hypothetical protein